MVMIKNSKQKVQLGLLEPKAIATFPIREGYTDSEVSERQMEYETGGGRKNLGNKNRSQR